METVTKKFKAFLEGLEMSDIDDLIELPAEDLKRLGEEMVKLAKSSLYLGPKWFGPGK
jgi:hypothetical protein